ncbi:MAG: DNA polymerase III subunit delta, partial [Sporomusaceae bacterium]|nr:DNA polymerase III subunit delta [Sporomusaceae bacterium]
ERLINLFGNLPPYSYLVFTSGEKADKRRKIYKGLEKHGTVVEANPLKGRELREWLWEKIAELNLKMPSEAKEHLLFAVNMMPQASLDFLQNELEKIALYSGSAAVTLPKLKEILAKAPEISIFAMVEALRQKELALALALLQDQLKTGKHPVQILALLAKQVEQLLKTKELLNEGYDPKKIAAYFKLPLFIGEKLARQSRNFAAAALTGAIVDLAQADHLLKSGRSGAYVLERIMIELCAE